jgi:hypothetical protein
MTQKLNELSTQEAIDKYKISKIYLPVGKGSTKLKSLVTKIDLANTMTEIIQWVAIMLIIQTILIIASVIVVVKLL